MMSVWRQGEAPWRRVQDGLFAGLTLVLWLAGNCLAGLGVVMATFFLLSGASFHAFLLHLHNLTVRYVAADSLRQAAFQDMTVAAMTVLLAGVCVVRLPVLCRRLRGSMHAGKGGQA